MSPGPGFSRITCMLPVVPEVYLNSASFAREHAGLADHALLGLEPLTGTFVPSASVT